MFSGRGWGRGEGAGPGGGNSAGQIATEGLPVIIGTNYNVLIMTVPSRMPRIRVRESYLEIKCAIRSIRVRDRIQWPRDHERRAQGIKD